MKISDNGNRIEMRLPINMHMHFRQGPFLNFLVGEYIKCGFRYLVEAMPNPEPPNLDGPTTIKYCESILSAAKQYPNSEEFMPIPSVQITKKTTTAMLEVAISMGIWLYKIYPFQVTNNSELGVEDYHDILLSMKFLQGKMVRGFDGALHEATVMLHAESPNPRVQGMHKESHFIENELQLILDTAPNLSISLEHISTAHAVRFLEKYGYKQRSHHRIVGTVGVTYLCSTLDDVIGYTKRSRFKIWPHAGCKPVPKLNEDLVAIVAAATSDMACILFGDDTAPHLESQKHAEFGSCGTANMHASLPMITEVFEVNGALQRQDDFLSGRAMEFHELPTSKGRLFLNRKDWQIPDRVPVPRMNDFVIPWMARETVHWEVE